jgi:hypothetical protein
MVSKKYTRREFLKQGAKTGASAGIYALVGGAIGKVYDTVSKAYTLGIEKVGAKLSEYDREIEKSENPVIRATVEPVSRVEDWRGRFYRRLIGRDDSDVEEWREKYNIPSERKSESLGRERKVKEERTTRRGFFKKLASYFSDHPVESGIGIGATYGGGKALLGSGQGLQTARIRDSLEDLQQDNKGLTRRVRKLEKGLEEIVGKEGKGGTMMVLGLGMLFLSIITSSVRLTGFSILEVSKEIYFGVSGIFFLIGFCLIIVYNLKRFK